MSQTQRRSRNGGITSRTQPSILKSRKRKISENDLDSTIRSCKKESSESPMATAASPVTTTTTTTTSTASPLGDVTLISLNVERERAITPDAIPEDWHKFRGFTCYPTPQTKRRVPLPNLSWADKEQVWELMCRKDSIYKINPNYLKKHPALQARMRAILLDWLTEVCEVYKLHRETYYLATAYIDRYLSLTENAPKAQMQLIGITALSIAAKIEEIYPPKLAEFSYVTDGACEDEEILEKELVILKTLNWDLTPVTSNAWLNTYLQLLNEVIQQESVECSPDKEEAEDRNFIFPNYSGLTFVQVARLLDLCILDMSSLEFSSSKLAATALGFLASFPLACRVSGYSLEDLKECLAWMAPFAVAVQEMGPAPLKSFQQVASDDVHNIQTHAVSLETLERVLSRRNQLEENRSSPPMNEAKSPEVLTPPKTDEKNRSPN